MSRVLHILMLSACSSLALSGELIEFITIAESSDPTYQAALAAASAVRSETGVARAGLLPNLSFQAKIGGNTQDIDVAPGAFGLDGRQSFDSENYELRAEQPLLRYDRWLKVKQVDRRIAQAEAEVAAIHADLVMKVAERYLNIIGARSEVATTQAELDALLAQLDQTQARFELGVATDADLLQAQADSDRAAADLIRAESNVAVAEDSLAEIIGAGASVTQELNPAMELPHPEPNTIEHWASLARSQNPRVLAAETQIEIAGFDRKIAQAGHLPTVGLVGKYGFDAQGGRFGETDITGRSIGIEVEVPIFQGGAVRAQTQVAGYKFTEAQSRAEAEARSAERSAKEAFRRMVMTIASAKASNRAVESSAAARDALQAQYDGGVRTLADLIDAEQDVFEAKKELSRAQTHYLINALKLRLASGALSTADINRVESALE